MVTTLGTVCLEAPVESQVDAFITSDLNCDTRRRRGGFVFKCDDPTDAAAVA